jgi:hypothetical protein
MVSATAAAALITRRQCQHSRWLGSKAYTCKNPWLFVGSGVMVRLSPHQSCEEGAEESFAAAPGVVYELEEAEVKWQLLL